MKKILVVMLSVSLLLGTLSGCLQQKAEENGGGNETKNGTSATNGGNDTTASPSAQGTTNTGIDFSEEPYELTVCYGTTGEEQPDMARIEELLNEITLREINCKVNLEPVALFNMANTYALKASSQEKMDLIMLLPGSTFMGEYANSNMIQPIDEQMAQWGGEISKALGEKITAGSFKGKLYGIVQPDPYVNGFGFQFPTSLTDKYNIKINEIKSLEDLDAIFERVHAADPEMGIILPETPTGTIASMFYMVDTLGVGPGSLDQDSMKVVNSLETQEYKDSATKVREWYEKGYISKDVSTSQNRALSVIMEGKLLSSTVGGSRPSGGFNSPIPCKYVVLPDQKPLMTTNTFQTFMWAVPTSAQRPDKSIQFMNLLFGNTEAANLIRFGIKDEHYTIDEDGTVTFNINPNYQSNFNCWGDVNKYPVFTENVALMGEGATADDYLARLEQYNKDTKISKAFGFTFDPAPVKTEIAACDAVYNEYNVAIGNGTVDPAIELPKYIEKYNAAGAQKVIEEKQRQLDEWLASQK